MRSTFCCGLVIGLVLCTRSASAQQPQPSPAPAQPQAPPTGTTEQQEKSAGKSPAQPAPPREPAAKAGNDSQAKTRQTSRQSRQTRRASGARASNRESRKIRDEGPAANDVTLTGNLSGGYDDNVGNSVGSGGSVSQVPASGSTGFADAMVEYFHGRPGRSLTLKGLANTTVFPGYLDAPAPAYKARLVWTTEVRQSSKLRFSTQGRYEPMFTPGIEDSGELASITSGRDAVPPVVPVGSASIQPSLLLRKSWVNSTKAQFETAWSSKDSTSVFYNFFIQRFIDNPSAQTYNDGSVDYSRLLNEATSLSVSYRYLDGDYTDNSGTTRPRQEQTVHVGLVHQRRLTDTRQISFAVSGGATWISSLTQQLVPYRDRMPTGDARLTLDISPSWFVGTGYQRRYTAMQGLTSEIFANDTAFVSLGGRLLPRVFFEAGGTIANGRTRLAPGIEDTFRLNGQTAGIRIDIAKAMAMTATYFNYTQRYSNPDSLPTGFPAEYKRHAFTVGMTFWVPLRGRPEAKLRLPAQW